jgi:Putative transposase/Transposase zinc-binding domain
MKDTGATIQNILRIGWESYEHLHCLPKYILSAVSALLSCRTAALGGHVQGCPDGHFHRHWYNSCKHRLCPQCAYILIERWLQKQKARLLGTDHYHVIFTIPHELNDIWLQNVKIMTGLLFRAVRDTLFDFIEDEKHVGGTPGIIASLHTWSQTLILHLHVHCLITCGGLDSSGTWQKPKRSTFLPYKAVMIKYRGKLLDYIDIAVRKGEIMLPPDMSRQQWINLRNKLGRKVKWNVNFRERYKGGQGVVTYLARYLRGGPISNHRIISCDNGKVRFSIRMNGSNSGKKSIMTLPVAEFIQRYLLHVPVPHAKRVRSYGLYASGNQDKLDECRKIFGQLPVADTEFLTWHEYCEKRGETHPEQCPICGKRLIILEAIPRSNEQKTKFIPIGGHALFYRAAA